MAKKKISKEVMVNAFIRYVLEHGKQPTSVFKFAEELGISESVFYDHFGSFRGLETSIWTDFMQETIAILDKDTSYAAFNAREKLLSFYFTHVQQLRAHRSFILAQTKELKPGPEVPYFLKNYRDTFLEYAQSLIKDGIESGEIADRKYLSDQYYKGFWVQLLFVLKFWVDDDSAGFEKTDEAIEKAVNLSFDLIGRGPLESVIDFAKFVAQNR
ncbi:MAG: TetR/AcrR family transcriptional regulator [Saprospiraceae bacterium]|nr:TetR/AcrR family transcriptional regulator [Saprospiraceae bacterium]